MHESMCVERIWLNTFLETVKALRYASRRGSEPLGG